METKLTVPARGALALAVAAALAACASAPKSVPVLEEARAAYQRAASDGMVARSAQVELRRAQQEIARAEQALREDEGMAAVEHHAYLARQRTDIALEAARIAAAERAVMEASAQRERIIAEARAREAQSERLRAESARAEAEQARRAADEQRRMAEAQRRQAEESQRLAEQRLAAARASQEQATAAAERARSLEEQLAEMKAKQTERGMVLTLGDVLFDTGRAQLHTGANRTLDQLAQFLRQNPERSIRIEGHTDSVGAEEMNRALSEQRANAVKAALVDRGVGVERITARGLGESQPVAGNDTAAGRQQNRRVEVVIAEKS